MIKIHGVMQYSLTDYPDEISTVLFVRDCNFRCRYCHNAAFAWGLNCKELQYNDVLNLLLNTKEYLTAVVISGGEPLLYPNIDKVFNDIKALGLHCGLHSNGYNTYKLSDLILNKTIDFIAMDIKAPIEKY